MTLHRLSVSVSVSERGRGRGVSLFCCPRYRTFANRPAPPHNDISSNSSFQGVHIIKGRRVFIKRDDLYFNHGVNGNKARKFHRFGSLVPFPRSVFSIGGVQSNSMLAIAKIVAQHTGSRFYYITKPIPKFLKDKPSGNYSEAIGLGMQILEASVKEYQQLMTEQHNYKSVLSVHQSLINHLKQRRAVGSAAPGAAAAADDGDGDGDVGDPLPSSAPPSSCSSSCFWIPQGGGGMAGARAGLDLLGADLEQHLLLASAATPTATAQHHHSRHHHHCPSSPSPSSSSPPVAVSASLSSATATSSARRHCQIFVESGTGATALYLHQYFERRRQQQQQQRPGRVTGGSRDDDSSSSSSSGGSGSSSGIFSVDDDDAAACPRWSVSVKAVSCVMPPADLLRNMETILRSDRDWDRDSDGSGPLSKQGQAGANLFPEVLSSSPLPALPVHRSDHNSKDNDDHWVPQKKKEKEQEKKEEKKEEEEKEEEKFVPFGTPQASHLAIWRYLSRCTGGVVFDLLYAPKAFEQIFQHWNEEDKQRSSQKNAHAHHTNTGNAGNDGGNGKMKRSNCTLVTSKKGDDADNNNDGGDNDYDYNDDDGTLYIYVHCGGAEGNTSQLNRYKYLKLISRDDDTYATTNTQDDRHHMQHDLT